MSDGKKQEWKAVTAAEIAAAEKKNGIGHKLYEQLMNGINHMLPFVVSGGILMAIAFLIDGLCVDINDLSEAERASFGSITKSAAMFKQIGQAAFDFMLPVLAGYIAAAVADTPGLAPGVAGGFLAATGKSGFIGAIVAGYAAGYAVYLLKRGCTRLPKSLEKIAPVLIYPLFGVLFIGLAMLFVIEPVMGVLNTALNDFLLSMGGSSRMFFGFVLGAMMSVDMGGPFNKTAYLFSMAAMASGNYSLMPSVMIGGMIPPCAVAVSAMVFRRKFTKSERDSAPSSLIMGLAFISEGAIPYAAADPLRVLPSCIIGAGVGGALSAQFGCTMMAPHGGIFAFPVAGNAGMMLLSFVIGTVTAAVLMGVLKKRVKG